MVYQLSENDIWFPDPSLADDDGLLAVGGDLSIARLMLAYQHGIFPWYSDETPVLWYSPHERFVLYPSRIRTTKSLRKIMRSSLFRVTMNEAFPEVIRSCAGIHRPGQPGTWITAEMERAYIGLHENGVAHSFEVWKDNELAGGLYGVAVNNVFCGESMFSRVSNASKVALAYLCERSMFKLIDCQVYTDHLASLGAETISRDEYMRLLRHRE